MAELPKTYEPGEVEDRWYARWLDGGYFRADPASAKPAYAIVIPPPNVTGVLTMGHVLNNTIQDILARKARMDGKEVLWLPGTDHAGIATQTVVERTLRKRGEIKHRDDLGRERFLERVWDWKEQHGGIIVQQLRKLGCSCDWSRERFTMDERYSRCVQRVFVELHRQGLIYRGRRMVNWDPVARTALSDEEVIMTEEAGHLWHIRYPLVAAAGATLTGETLVVATTRPETMLGDEAVAVHPGDDRYRRLIGRRCLLPLRNKPIPVIGDGAVDPKFGTGCVKVTPAHDPADYEMALRHGLPVTVVIAPDGTMTAEAGDDFCGLDRMEARQAVVEELTEQHLLAKIEEYTHSVGYSERSHVPVEPYLSEQWFLKYPRVAASAAAVASGAIRFHPERWAKTYAHWMANIRDWCISRQLWWGHRLPVWYRRGTTAGESGRGDGGGHGSRGAAPAEIHVGLEPPPDPENWEQDPDVLDTWFSSWLWPFATMGWPEKTPTLARFYPTSDLVTGPDIIFFWVARMIMAGYEFMGDKPFANVYFTGIIRDKLGRKMSKSLGNSPDPLDLIARYGADALRYGTMRSAPLGQDILFDEKQVELGRNFCTKLWNAARFRQLQGDAAPAEIDPALLGSDERWLLLRLDRAVAEVTAALAEYRFNEAVNVLHRFFWAEYCDWYLEASKAALAPDRGAAGDSGGGAGAGPTAAAGRANALAVMDFVLDRALRLFHPFLPFITEELWHGLGYGSSAAGGAAAATIQFAPWPEPFTADFKRRYGLTAAAEEFAAAKYETVVGARNLRGECGVASNRKVKFSLKAAVELPPAERAVLQLLLNASELEILPAAAPTPPGTPATLGPWGELLLPLAGAVDLGAEADRLRREIAKVEAELEKVGKKLASEAFVGKAPAAVVAEHRAREAGWVDKLERLRQLLAGVGSGG